MKRWMQGALVGLVGGFVAGWVFFAPRVQHASTASGDDARLTTAGLTATPAGETSRPDAAPHHARRQEAAATGAPLSVDGHYDNDEKAARLMREVDELHRRLEQATEELTFTQGKPVPFPDKLAPQYLQAGMLETLNKAFEEAGVPGEITVVDCDEYPCLACGRLPPQPADQPPDINADMQSIRRTSQTDAMEVYSDAAKAGGVSTSKVKLPDGSAVNQTVFCQAFYPKPDDEELKRQIDVRTRWRMEQLQDGM